MKTLLKEEFKVIESKDDKKRKENAMFKINDILKTWMEKVNSMENESSKN